MKNGYSYVVRQACCLAALCLVTCAMATAQVAVATYHNDNYRSGTNSQETILTPSNVNVQSFGKCLTFPVQGYVYAQPLYVPWVVINGAAHNVVYVATEHDQLYAFDAKSGQQPGYGTLQLGTKSGARPRWTFSEVHGTYRD